MKALVYVPLAASAADIRNGMGKRFTAVIGVSM
jgi:hypothetical protein